MLCILVELVDSAEPAWILSCLVPAPVFGEDGEVFLSQIKPLFCYSLKLMSFVQAQVRSV